MYPLTGKTIVLDIDETLVNSKESHDLLKTIPLDKPEVMKSFYSLILPDYYHIWGLMRPGCKDFLRFCFDYFDKVLVWSAGEKNYVETITYRLFEGLPEPDGVFSRSLCGMEDGNTTKPLLKLSHHYPDINLTNILILDDREHNFIDCNPYNAIHIPPFKPYDNLSGQDKALYQVMEWLLRPEVRTSSDVRKLDKSGIFTQPVPIHSYSTAFQTRMIPTFGSLTRA